MLIQVLAIFGAIAAITLLGLLAVDYANIHSQLDYIEERFREIGDDEK